MSIPVMGNPGKRRRKSRRSGMSACALKLRRSRRKGRRSRASRGQRRHARKIISAYRKSRRGTKRRHKKSLSSRLFALITGGGGKHREKKIANLRKKIAQVESGQKTREYKKAARAEDRGLGYSFFGSNPRRRHMARRRKHHARRNPPSATAGITAGLRPHNVIGILPYVGGALLNTITRRFIGAKVPMLNSGIPGIVLGVGTAGLVGLIGSKVSASVGQAMLDGALLDLGLEAAEQFGSKLGMHGLGMGPVTPSIDNGIMSGIGDFVTPYQAEGAYSLDGSMNQYPMPVPGSQQIPMSPGPAHMHPQAEGHHAMPHPAASAHAPASGASPHEENDAISAMIAETDMASM